MHDDNLPERCAACGKRLSADRKLAGKALWEAAEYKVYLPATAQQRRAGAGQYVAHAGYCGESCLNKDFALVHAREWRFFIIPYRKLVLKWRSRTEPDRGFIVRYRSQRRDEAIDV